MSIMDNAVYVDGKRTANPISLDETCETARERGGIAWVDLAWPEPAEIRAVAEEFSLHLLAVEDAIHAHQRPKIEQYDDVLYVVVHPARNVDDDGDGLVDRVEFGEVHAWVGPDFVVTIRRSVTPDLASMRTRLESDPDVLRHGPTAILATLLDQVVDTYRPVVTRLRTDIDQIEDQLSPRPRGVPADLRGDTRGDRAAAGTHPLVDIVQQVHDDEAGEPGADRTSVVSCSVTSQRAGPRRQARGDVGHVPCAAHERPQRALHAGDPGAERGVAPHDGDQPRAGRADEEDLGLAAILFAPTLDGTIYGMGSTTCPSCPGCSGTRSRSPGCSAWAGSSTGSSSGSAGSDGGPARRRPRLRGCHRYGADGADHPARHHPQRRGCHLVPHRRRGHTSRGARGERHPDDVLDFEPAPRRDDRRLGMPPARGTPCA